MKYKSNLFKSILGAAALTAISISGVAEANTPTVPKQAEPYYEPYYGYNGGRGDTTSQPVSYYGSDGQWYQLEPSYTGDQYGNFVYGSDLKPDYDTTGTLEGIRKSYQDPSYVYDNYDKSPVTKNWKEVQQEYYDSMH